MTCDHVRARMDDYLAGRVNQADRDTFDEHVAACVECRTDLEAARLLRPAVATLPRSVAPERSLWEGIESRLDMPPGRARPPRWLLPLAAALATVAIGSLVLLGVGRSGSTSTASIPFEVRNIAAAYGEAAADLQRVLESESRTSQILPAAVAAASPNLATLDLAIEESRSALERDPQNPALQQFLLSAHRKKLELLRQVTAVDMEE